MISGVFWNKLPKDLQKLVTDTWEDRIGDMRAFAQERQGEARDVLIQNGIEFVVPTKEESAKARAILMKTQDALVKELGMDEKLVAKAKAALPEG